MSAWLQKVNKFKAVLDVKVSEHKSSVKKVKSNLRSLAQDASAVQPRMLFELALANPKLAALPDDVVALKQFTIYDTIQYNLVELLIMEGEDHLEKM
jgi:hypothetical protein